MARTAPGVVQPHVLALGRWALAGAILVFIARGELLRQRSHVLRVGWQYLVLGAVVWLGERFSWRQDLGVLIAMAGVFHVVIKGQWLRPSQVEWVPGDAWIVAAMVAWAAYALLQKKWASRVAASLYLGPLYGGLTAWGVLSRWTGTTSGAPA